jgi:hypothetical protein
MAQYLEISAHLQRNAGGDTRIPRRGVGRRAGRECVDEYFGQAAVIEATYRGVKAQA